MVGQRRHSMSNEEFRYIPDMGVVRSARSFIQSLCQAYGTSEGMAVWDKIRSNLSEQMASDIFLGMLMGTGDVEIVAVGSQKIEAIKEVRAFTGMGLKESKDLIEAVQYGKPHTIDCTGRDNDDVNRFVESMRKCGCTIK